MLDDVFIVWSGVLSSNQGLAVDTAIYIAQTRVVLSATELFIREIVCNALVCLAVWLCYAAQDVAGEIPATHFHISAFLALGFEHSAANMYLIPVAMLHGVEGVDISGLIHNLIPATLGNIVVAGVFVALVYWLVYVRKQTYLYAYPRSSGLLITKLS